MRHGAVMHAIEVVCGDEAEHRRRVRARVPEHDQAFQPSWDEARAREFVPWRQPRLLVDTCVGDTPTHVRLILGAIRGHAAPA